jgi:hypothetical protein
MEIHAAAHGLAIDSCYLAFQHDIITSMALTHMAYFSQTDAYKQAASYKFQSMVPGCGCQTTLRFVVIFPPYTYILHIPNRQL